MKVKNMTHPTSNDVPDIPVYFVIYERATTIPLSWMHFGTILEVRVGGLRDYEAIGYRVEQLMLENNLHRPIEYMIFAREPSNPFSKWGQKEREE